MSEFLKSLLEDFSFLKRGADNELSLDKDEFDLKIKRAIDMDEVDTVTFGLETDDGRIVKVYVKAEQADDFEKALADMLGRVDVIEDALNELSSEFEIVDVDWPDDEQDAETANAQDNISPDALDDTMDSEDESPLAMLSDTDGDGFGDESHPLSNLDGEPGEATDNKHKNVSMSDEAEAETPPEDDVDTDTEGEEEAEAPAPDESGEDGGEEKSPKKKKDDEGATGPEADDEEEPSDDEESDKESDETSDEENPEDEVLSDKDIEDALNGKKPKKKKKKKAPVVEPEAKQESLTYGQRIALKMLNEAKAKLTDDLKQSIRAVANGDLDIDSAEGVYDVLFDFYLNTGDMPYGTAKARNGDPYAWIVDRLEEEQKRDGLKSLFAQLEKHLKEDNNPSFGKLVMNNKKTLQELAKSAAEDEKNKDDVVADEGPEKNLLDARLRRPLEKMIYHTILDLGVPDAALAKSSFRQTIITAIREKANDLLRNSKKRLALAWYLSRVEMAEEIEAEVDRILAEETVLNEGAVDDLEGFITNFLKFFDTSKDDALAMRLINSSVFQQYLTRTKSAMTQRGVSMLRSRLAAAQKVMDDISARMKDDVATPAVQEALDDVSDEPDHDVEIADKVIDKTKPAAPAVSGIEAKWGINKDSENMLLAAEVNGKRVLSVHLSPEHVEALDKAFGNNAVIVLPDAKSKVKYSFSPRRGSYTVKKVGDDAKRAFIMTKKDIDGFQDLVMDK
jgi:hypothetical protein